MANEPMLTALPAHAPLTALPANQGGGIRNFLANLFLGDSGRQAATAAGLGTLLTGGGLIAGNALRGDRDQTEEQNFLNKNSASRLFAFAKRGRALRGRPFQFIDW